MKKIIITLLLLFTLGACGTEDNDTTPNNNITLTDIYYELEVDDTINYYYQLPQTIQGIDITWQSSVVGIIEDNQLANYVYSTDTTLIASFSLDGKTMTKTFNVEFLGQFAISFEEWTIQQVIVELHNMYHNMSLEENITLPTTHENVAIAWNVESDYMTNQGVVTRPTSTVGDQTVTYTITASYNGYSSDAYISFIVNALPAGNVYTGYYEGMDGLTGNALRNFLNELIDDHNILTYDEVKYAIRETDEDPTNSSNVILFYTGRSQGKDTFISSDNNQDDYNREHVWAKYHGGFGNDPGPGTDLHHIRPTDASVNNSRGNLEFDEGGSEIYDMGVATGNFKDSDSWEPRDEVKGDVARMLFYMAIRYEGDDGFVDLELNNSVNNGSAPFIGNLEVLLQWHLEDPVDEFEMNRNDVIYSYQGNRNPFIDHPELVELIWGNSN